MRKAIVSLILVASTALASAGDASAQRFGYGSYNSSNSYYSAYNRGYGYSPYYQSYGYGNSAFYRGYGYAPDYQSYGYGYAPYYQSYGYYGNSPSSYYSEPTTRQSFAYSPAETAPQYAALTVVVPTTNAQVWFGDAEMAQRGTVRLFHSPSLEPGKNFIYTIKARWMEQGASVERDRRVNVRAGQKVTVDFRDSSENAPAPDALRR